MSDAEENASCGESLECSEKRNEKERAGGGDSARRDEKIPGQFVRDASGVPLEESGCERIQRDDDPDFRKGKRQAGRQHWEHHEHGSPADGREELIEEHPPKHIVTA